VYGLFAKIIEGPSTGYNHSLVDSDNQPFDIITTDKTLSIGDCVKVTSARKVHMKKVDASFCDFEELLSLN